MKYGYARCSTNEDKQDIQRQIRELKASGAQEIVFEYEHGDAKVKRNLQMLLDTAREGDTIITLEVSRLSRSTQQLCQIIDIIREKRLCLQIVGSITINCHNGQADPMSEAFLQMAGMSSFVVGRRPICLPLAFAFAMPDLTRARIMASSSWLNTPAICRNASLIGSV